jgi:glycosyltransferase involved in cell wall biosynthesis
MNSAKRDTCIIVPCYNESGRLDIEAVRLFCKKDTNTDFIFVNDGSTDNTLELIKNACSTSDSLGYISLPMNLGKAEAVRAGFIQALSGNYTYIGYLDADLSTPLDELHQLRQTLVTSENIDIAIGSRVKMLGYEIERNLVRHIVGRVFATMASITLGLPVYDTQCGAKLFVNNRNISILFGEPFINKWTFDVEIIKRHLIMVSLQGQSGHRIEEVPLRMWRDIAGSNVKPIDFIISIKNMIQISTHYSKKCTIEHYQSMLESANSRQSP